MKRRDEHKKILRFLIVTFTFFSLKALADEKLQSCTLTISDFSQSHEWTVQAIEAPHTITDLQNLVRSTNLPISVRGGGFSHGGQTVADNGLVIETKNMNRVVSYDPQQKTITVEPGITWKQVQEHIVKDGLAVEVMQSFNNFSVGGSLGVNVHGRYLAYGPIISTVREIKVMMADGEIVTASRTENVDLFRSAIGGEGAVGIIVEAKLGLAENTKLDRSVRNFTATKDGLVDMIKDYITYFDKEVLGTGQAEMTNAILYPPDYRTLRSVTFNRTDKPLTITDQMQNLPTTKWGWLYRGALNSIVSLFDFIKKFRESQYDRQEEPQVVMRNWEASEDVESLKGLNEQFPWIKRIFPFSNRKALLQEYFIPREALPQFIERLVAVFTKYDVNVINISLRRIPANDESYMSWSRHEGFAVVVYYSQPYRGDKNQQLAKHRIWTREIIDEINRVDGSYYLPYLVEASQEQFQKAYPNYKKFFEVKKHFDPNNRFTNNLWAQYYKP